MKIVAVIFLWLAVAVVAPAQTNQSRSVCRDPVRVFGPTSVNLTPLFEWWARQPVATNAAQFTSAVIDVNSNTVVEGDRPLIAWHRVTGPHVGTLNNGNWVVDAVVYTSPSSRTNARIILTRPPTGEEQNFYTFKTELDQATLLITNAARAYQADIKEQQKDLQLEDAYRYSNTKVASDGARVYSQLAAQKQQQADADASQQQQLQTQRDQIQTQLKAIPADNGAYRVDWFAIMIGRTKQGLPIYDLGVVRPTAP